MEGQESAIRATGLLGHDKESVEQIVNAGVCSVFFKILKEGHMKVQIAAAWAVSEFAANYPECKDHFLQNNMIRLLVTHLAFETIVEHSKYTIYAVVMAKSDNDAKNKQDYDDKSHGFMTEKSPSQSQQRREKSKKRVSLSGTSIKGREFEDPATKAEMKAMAARALWHLCADHFAICKTITESRALLCFTVLLEKGEEQVKYNSAMALMEITAVTESHAELRRSAFKPTSPTAREVVDKFLKIVNKGESDLLIPSIESIGHLARTFRATETRIIPSLVRLLDDRETEVSAHAAIALIKMLKTPLAVAFKVPGLILLCYIALHVPDSETLAQEDVHIVLQWALKQGHLMQDSQLETLVLEAKQRLEIYQSRA
ncbi:hypothetical protein R6Q59_004750 [Mikania micrantha]